MFSKWLGGVGLALALMAGTPASAATVIVGAGDAPVVLVNGNTYIVDAADGLKAPGSGAFSDVYSFTYSPPPSSSAFDTATNNLLTATFGIPDLTFTWTYVTGATTLIGPLLVGSGFVNLNLPLLGAGLYTITFASVAGPLSDGGFYTNSLTAVPVPPAVVLFLSALAGLGLLGRRRRNKAQALPMQA